MNIKKSILLRVRIAFLLVFVFSIAVGWRIVHIQFAEGEKWTKIQKETGLKYRKVAATRGNIFSDNGSLLATSLPFFKVAFDPSIPSAEVYKKGIDSLSLLLSQYFKDKSPEDYKQKIKNARASGKKYILLNTHQFNYQVKKQMVQWPIFREGRLKGGVIFERVDKRFRPFSFLGFRTIGFLNDNRIGAGLEYSFNSQLAGVDGEALFQKMAGGHWKPIHDRSEIEPMEGWDIETTIDINLQDVAESALLQALKYHRADYGCVVVMEVQTGEIKAIANLRLLDGEYMEIYNYAVQGLTEPGSTFKLASMIALLEDSNVKLTDTIDTEQGQFKFYDRTMADHKPGGYGKITVKQAFEQSSNIAISKLINNQFGLNPHKYIDYINQMGLGKPFGFQMKGEGIPYFKTPNNKSWSGTTLPWMSIGYELKLTPLQTLTFFNAVANEGKMITPIIVKRIFKAGKEKEVFEAQVIKEKICSDETLQDLKILLEGVVENGTAINIKDSNYKIAGKTGTAQIIVNKRYTNNYYTSFAGYFPAESPKYSCIVVIDNPKGYNQYGSDVAAPVFKEVADKIFARDIDMHKEFPRGINADQTVFPLVKAGKQEDLKFICNELGISNHSLDDEEWVKAKKSDNSLAWQGKKIRNGLLPDVSGMTLKDAIYILENCGLKVFYQGKGRVTQQFPYPGTRVQKGNVVNIKLG